MPDAIFCCLFYCCSIEQLKIIINRTKSHDCLLFLYVSLFITLSYSIIFVKNIYLYFFCFKKNDYYSRTRNKTALDL